MEPIAITGIGCRLPGESNGPSAFGSNLLAGRDLISETPADRWSLSAYHAADPSAPGRTFARWGGFVSHPEDFDAAFFGISPREALRVDPQQRWLLETTWEALEDADYPPHDLAGTDVGVYVGISGSDYGDIQKRSRFEVDAYANSGSALGIAANRISYLLDFRGPSIAVDMACSSSLVALDLACRALMGPGMVYFRECAVPSVRGPRQGWRPLRINHLSNAGFRIVAWWVRHWCDIWALPLKFLRVNPHSLCSHRSSKNGKTAPVRDCPESRASLVR
jgi:hypothetical protein